MEKRAMGWVASTIVAILVLLVLGIIATVFQVYNFITYVQDEAPDLERNMKKVNEGDCSRLDDLEEGIDELVRRSYKLCRNPIIKIGVDNIEDMPIKCDDVDDIEDAMDDYLSLMDEYCRTGKISDPDKLQEVFEEISLIAGNMQEENASTDVPSEEGNTIELD